MVTVKVNGKEVQVPKNTLILDAAKEAGVHIPTLCHDSRLNPFGACRVCLVEQVGNPKLQAACTTPVTDGMEIVTQSDKLSRVRKTAIELLLINHPLDCPVCDKGGECTLQDLTYEVGVTKVRFDAKPNDTPVDHTNPFIERDIDRCVLCGRCVRVCDEVVNIQAISFLNRGTDTIIGTSFEQPWNCEYCGQCISVCPVGSLNNRIYLFKNRPWNLEREKSVCGLCSCGCTVDIDYEGSEVYRIKESPDEGINHGYMCAKGRFGFEFINSVKRQTEAQVKAGGETKAVSFSEAVDTAAEKIRKIKETAGADSVAVVVSPRLTNEEAFLAAKLAKDVIGTQNVFSTETAEVMPQATLEEVENSDCVAVINLDVTESNPILGLAVRHAARKGGAPLFVFYPAVTALKRVTKEMITGTPDEVMAAVDSFAKAVSGASNEYSAMASTFTGAERPVLVFDPYNPADAKAAQDIQKACPKAKLVGAKAKNNSVGIVDMGCGAKDPAEFAKGLESGKFKAVLCFGENIAIRTAWMNASKKLGSLELLMVTDPFMSETAAMANVYIPVATFAEKNGSFTNLEGRVQTIAKAVDKGVNTDACVASALSKALGSELPSDYMAVRSLIEKEVKLYSGISWDGGTVSYPYVFAGEVKAADEKAKGKGKFFLYPSSLRLHSGSFTRWSPDLAKVYGEPHLEVSVDDAKELGLKNKDRVKVKGEGFEGEFLVEIDKKVLKGCIALPEDFAATAGIFCNGKYLKADLVK